MDINMKRNETYIAAIMTAIFGLCGIAIILIAKVILMTFVTMVSTATISAVSMDSIVEKITAEKFTVDMNIGINEVEEVEPLVFEDNVIKTEEAMLIRKELPNIFYKDINYSEMQTFMRYTKVTDKSSSAYAVCYSDDAYTDSNGFRRYKTDDDQFTINNQDDYVVALGNFYKTKGVCGERFLIVTTTGAYTCITGDEKADNDTDSYKLFHPSENGTNNVSMIEFIVGNLQETGKNYHKLGNIATRGSVKYSENVEEFNGDILAIYKIEEIYNKKYGDV